MALRKSPNEQEPTDDGEELIRRFIEALARDAARYEFRRRLEAERGNDDDGSKEKKKIN